MNEEARRAVEGRVLDKTGEVIASVHAAKHVDEVISSLRSLVLHLFSHNPSQISGSVPESSADQSNRITEIEEWWNAFYRGPAFSMLSRTLLLDVSCKWLACFPLSVKEHVYDSFFTRGLMPEVVHSLAQFLHPHVKDNIDDVVIQSNTERLLVLCLLENCGIRKIVGKFRNIGQTDNHASSKTAMTISSIPDKARPKAPRSLLSHSFFKAVISQLFDAALDCYQVIPEDENSNLSTNGALLFAGETLARISRRGSTDIIVAELIPRVLGFVKRILQSSEASIVQNSFDSDLESQFWSTLMQAIRDPYAVEKLSDQLLRSLERENASDIEAYWILWMLFTKISHNLPSVSSLFEEKFLLWKVFPLCCARWIIQFSTLKLPPVANSLTKCSNVEKLLELVQLVVLVWCKREFVQSVPLEQQSYVTGILGLCLEMLSKDDLEKCKDAMHSILQGVSCRLESPTHVIRRMASSIALAFSLIMDPKNPLFLDEMDPKNPIDWEFGINKGEKPAPGNSSAVMPQQKTENELKKYPKLIDPNEIVDLATLKFDSSENDEDNASESSDSSDDSLQPYDLADDDSDLNKTLSSLADVIAALRKSDDPDGVERALGVVENLVRASPDELTHMAGDLARALVHVRCCDVALEGDEDSGEEKRQKSLVALLATCPFPSIEMLNKLLYSPNVDTSQRIMILDAMAEAAQELASSKPEKRCLITTISENQPWFLPNTGSSGAGLWSEVSESGKLVNYSYRYERELPKRESFAKKGKLLRRSSGRTFNENMTDWSQNKFPLYAAAFMLPAMEGFDKKRQGVDLLDRDFIVLGKLVHTLGVCMKCVAMHPEATILAPALLNMLQSSNVFRHKEAYVRKSVLFAASSILMSLPPSFLAAEGNSEICLGFEWIRTWAIQVTESDTDRDCYTMAIACLHLHSEMALQAARVMESQPITIKKDILLPPHLSQGIIKLPFSSSHS